MASEDEVQTQIREMAKLSILSNRISDVQAKNIKLYPFVFFDGVERAEVDYDLSSGRNVEVEEDPAELNAKYTVKTPRTQSRISYRLEGPINLKDKLEQRFEALEKAVRQLFWSDLKVELFINGSLSARSQDV